MEAERATGMLLMYSRSLRRARVFMVKVVVVVIQGILEVRVALVVAAEVPGALVRIVQHHNRSIQVARAERDTPAPSQGAA